MRQRKQLPMLPRDDLFDLAGKAKVDWRTIRNEINAMNGARKPVRGAAGERARQAINDYRKDHGV